MTQIAFKRAWESYMHYLNLKAGGSDKKRGKNDAQGRPTFIPRSAGNRQYHSAYA